MKSKRIAGAVLAVLLLTGNCLTAFAAQDTSSYGYLSGQQESSARHGMFEGASGLATDEQRESYYTSNGIGGDGQYSTSEHLDAEELLNAGIIDQQTANNITAYVSGKLGSVKNRYSADIDNMSPEQRNAYYEGFSKDGFSGDTLEELLGAGVITQEQAEAIRAYIG